MDMKTFIKEMPKVELHRHLSGALSSACMYSIAERKGFDVKGNSLESFRKLTSMYGEEPDFHTFLDKFISRAEFITDKSFISEIIKNVVREAADDNVIHLELRFSADHFSRHMNFNMEEITEQIISVSSEEAELYGLGIAFIMTLSRHIAPEKNIRMADISLESSLSRHIAGIDIAGDEANFPLDGLKTLMYRALDAGKKITVHAGEAGPASNVEEAIDEGAVRIGHGIQSFNDTHVLEKAVEKEITYEVCPTSNIQTGTVKSVQDIDIKGVMEKGARIAVCTDDPGVSDTDLSNEYMVVQEAFDLSHSDLSKLLVNAVQGAFAPDADKKKLKDRIEAYFRGNER